MKKVGYNHYFHKSNVFELKSFLPEETQKFLEDCAVYMMQHNLPFEVIKYNSMEKSFSLINAEGWDTLYEPIVRDSVKFHLNGKITNHKGGNQVYHQKHLFVAPDYQGFDIYKSYERTVLLESLPIVKNHKSKIGGIKFWNEVLSYCNLPKYM